MTRPRLHLDADASRKDLYTALVSKGHDVTRTPMPGLPANAGDEFQLLWASAHDRIMFTFNIKDFFRIARRIPEHKGILLASQQRYSKREVIAALDRVLTVSKAEDWLGQVRWLSDWR